MGRLPGRAMPRELLYFLVRSVFALELAVLFQFEPGGGIAAVFDADVSRDAGGADFAAAGAFENDLLAVAFAFFCHDRTVS